MGNDITSVYDPIKRGRALNIRDPVISRSWLYLIRTDWRFSGWQESCGRDIGNLLVQMNLWEMARATKIDDRLYLPEEHLVYSWIRGQDIAANIAGARLMQAAKGGRSGLYRKTWGDLLLRIIINDIRTISLQHNYENLIPLAVMDVRTLHAKAMIAMGFVEYARTRCWGNEWNDHNLSDYLESLMIFLGENIASGRDVLRDHRIELLFLLACFVFFIAYDDELGLANREAITREHVLTA